MAKFILTLERTRIQHLKVAVEASSERAAELQVLKRIKAGEDYEDLGWTQGENEGSLDVVAIDLDDKAGDQ